MIQSLHLEAVSLFWSRPPTPLSRSSHMCLTSASTDSSQDQRLRHVRFSRGKSQSIICAEAFILPVWATHEWLLTWEGQWRLPG